MYPFPEQEETEGTYDRTYYKSWGMEQGDNQVVRRMKMKTARLMLRTVEKFVPPGRLLDVGCAAGHFLETAQRNGWDVYGVELSSYAAQLAKEKFGDHIYAGPYETVPFTRDFFDCIIMSDVLEHFPDPQTAIELSGLLLKNNGLLVVVTPDTGSLSACILKTHWNHYNNEHLVYYNRKSIKLHLKRNGFATLIIRPAIKALNLRYIYSQMTAYPTPWLTSVVTLINRILPEALLGRSFFSLSGEMLIVARKEVFK